MKRHLMRRFNFRLLLSGLLPLFVVAHFGHHVMGSLLAPLMPMIRDELALNYTQSGVVLSTFAITSGISQLPAGWLADRIGPRIVVTLGIVGVALMGLLVGLSQTYIMLIILLVLMAVLGGGYHPAAAATISASVAPQNRGRALGLHLIGGTASLFAAPLLAAAIALVWGWRGAYIILAVPTFVLGIVLYILLGQHPGIKIYRDGIRPPADKTPATPHHLRHLIAFLIMSIFVGGLTQSLRSFIPLYVVDHLGGSEEAAAALMALPPLAGIWAAPLGGYLSDRFGRIPVTLIVCFLAGPTVYLLNLVPYGVAFSVTLIIYDMVTTARLPTSEAYIIGNTPSSHRSTVLGIYYFTGMEIGGLLTPVIGYLVDHNGFHYSFTVVSIALVAVSLICSPFLWGSRD